jgi:hypothetical protein
LQHADNPVDWYPWGPEAFAAAEKEDKPIFLSIGYATCHWCHVMEHESFEDSEVAQLMNEAFISIKVDREERPDLDQIYMTVSQLLTGSGGWPLTIIMSPDKKPFFAATYIPKHSRYGRLGMMELIPRVQDLWTQRRDDLEASATKIVEALQRMSAFEGNGEALDQTVLDKAYQQLAESFDTEQGGFAQAPKFPSPHNLLFLLRYWRRSGEEQALFMVEKTLRAMRRGGIFDQVGFGFHRYSTDARWLVPHFEKMLYDQAMLARAYTETYQATGDPFYQQTAEEIFAYVLRDMTSAQGGFYSAEDADSEGEEGKFYLWSYEELKLLTAPRELALLEKSLGVQAEGNYVDEATHRNTGENILHQSEPPSGDEFETLRRRLFEVREQRIHPLKDDKILTNWNGLMIASLAKAGAVFEKADYIHSAEKAAQFILENLRGSEGRLLHRYRAGSAGIQGFADDYAFFIWGLIELYEATFKTRYLESALELNEIFIDQFWDDDSGGGFFLTGDDAVTVLVRQRTQGDGALPSASSVALLNLLRLGRMTANSDYEQRADTIIRQYARQIVRYPTGYTFLLTGLDFVLGPSYEVVIVGARAGEDTLSMIRRLRSVYLPNKVVLFRPTDLNNPPILKLADFVRYQVAIDGRATVYVCQNYACELPTTDPDMMIQLFKNR